MPGAGAVAAHTHVLGLEAALGALELVRVLPVLAVLVQEEREHHAHARERAHAHERAVVRGLHPSGGLEYGLNHTAMIYKRGGQYGAIPTQVCP